MVNTPRKAVAEQPNAEAGNALGKGLGQLFQSKTQPHRPLIKTLGDLGIRVRVMPVMIGDEPVDCLVIPAQELLVKEYQLLSGIDANILLGDSTEKGNDE